MLNSCKQDLWKLEPQNIKHLKEGFHFHPIIVSNKCLVRRCVLRTGLLAPYLDNICPETFLACEKLPKMFVVLQRFDWYLAGKILYTILLWHMIVRWRLRVVKICNIIIWDEVFIVGLSKLRKSAPAALLQCHLHQVFSFRLFLSLQCYLALVQGL